MKFQTRFTLRSKVMLVILGLTALVCILFFQQEYRHPVPLAALDGDVFTRRLPSDLVRRGSSKVWIFRLAADAEFVPYYYADAGLSGPASVDVWMDHLQVPLVFNAGQYDEKNQHLGWLKGDGRWHSKQKSKVWEGVLLSGALDSQHPARIADLSETPDSVVEGYQHVVQSMMLLDQRGHSRVRESERDACRTVVAEDQLGHILVIFTEGAVRLNDLARWLAESDLGIVRAMNLDGGRESQFALRSGSLHIHRFGRFATIRSRLAWLPMPMERGEIPAVIAVRRAARSGVAPRANDD